jgi:outer membrane beta-barrel protein
MSRWHIVMASLALASSALPSTALAQGQRDELFKDVEVRVIRQKYFQKSMRPEFGAQLSSIMNRSFVYTMMGSAYATFHINEQVGIIGEGGMGFTLNKGDCSTLGEKFQIEPVVDDLKNWVGGGIAYTPIYGKYQLSSGDLIYFDWFFNFTGGMASTAKRLGTCIPSSTEESEQSSMPQVGVSTGQRYFLNKNTAATWAIQYMMVQNPYGGSIVSDPINNVLLSLGLSYFL